MLVRDIILLKNNFSGLFGRVRNIGAFTGHFAREILRMLCYKKMSESISELALNCFGDIASFLSRSFFACKHQSNFLHVVLIIQNRFYALPHHAQTFLVIREYYQMNNMLILHFVEHVLPINGEIIFYSLPVMPQMYG